MIDYNPEYISLPATIDEALAMSPNDLDKLMDDPETAPYVMLLALPTADEWYDSEAELLEAELTM